MEKTVKKGKTKNWGVKPRKSEENDEPKKLQLLSLAPRDSGALKIIRAGNKPNSVRLQGSRDGHLSDATYPPRSFPRESSTGRCIFSPEREKSGLLGLAPDGVYPAPSVTLGAVRSYRTLSPLPRKTGHPVSRGGLLSVALSVFPRPIISDRSKKAPD